MVDGVNPSTGMKPTTKKPPKGTVLATNKLIISGWFADANPLTGLSGASSLTILDGQNTTTYVGPSCDAYLIDPNSSAISPALVTHLVGRQHGRHRRAL